jgi:hypothetical protein
MSLRNPAAEEYPPYIDLGGDFAGAVEARDEAKLRELVLQAMKLFLEGQADADDLESWAATHMTVPISLGWRGFLEITDPRLRYVLTELSAISVVDDARARMNVKRYIRFLQGEDYERMDA